MVGEAQESGAKSPSMPKRRRGEWWLGKAQESGAKGPSMPKRRRGEWWGAGKQGVAVTITGLVEAAFRM
jgi:hypothetical protein